MKKIIYKILKKSFKILFQIHPHRYLNISKLIQSAQIYTINKKSKKYKFNIINNYDYSYFENFYEREKDTTEWVLSIPPKSIFFDIGANIGQYTIMSALHCEDIKVVAFEPVAKNYFVLVRNISKLIPADICSYCLTLTNNINFASLKQLGAAFGTNEYRDYLNTNYNLVNMDNSDLFFHGTVNTTLDEFCKKTNTYPTHIKIDIDGKEIELLQGSLETLNNKKLKSIIIEIGNYKINNETKELIESFGFKGSLSNKRNGNHIFYR